MTSSCRLAAALSGMFLLAGCDLITETLRNLEPERFSLQPVIVGMQVTQHRTRSGTCTGIDEQGGLSSSERLWRDGGGLEVLGALVGYESVLIRGQDPFPCDTWIYSAFQAKVFFDLSGLPEGTVIDDAVLRYTRRNEGGIEGVSQTSPCVYVTTETSGLSTTQIARASGPDAFITGRTTRPQTQIGSGVTFGLERTGHAVSSSLSRTLRSGAENTWFVFSPQPGRAFTEHDEAGGAAYCTIGLRDIVLEIDALVPVSG
ncbi:hypothetical protein [uncultured Roseobacter sp.]|uniref:hypothetical protein n=1 Tax=uncultured Roseobacter sp. TaxID=114847 RepID=UPI0026252223|nr:hypothetical protein [uncultured Roseobacter sp.]